MYSVFWKPINNVGCKNIEVKSFINTSETKQAHLFVYHDGRGMQERILNFVFIIIVSIFPYLNKLQICFFRSEVLINFDICPLNKHEEIGWGLSKEMPIP